MFVVWIEEGVTLNKNHLERSFRTFRKLYEMKFKPNFRRCYRRAGCFESISSKNQAHLRRKQIGMMHRICDLLESDH